MINKFITIVLLIWIVFIKAQDNNDSIQQTKISTFLRNMETKKEQTTFLIYNIGKDYLVITKLESSFSLYWYKESMDFTNQLKTYSLVKKQLYIKDKLLEKLFKNKCSNVDYVNENDGSSYIYFGLYSNNIKKCEFITPYIYYNKEKKPHFPIKRIYVKYLTENLLNIN